MRPRWVTAVIALALVAGVLSVIVVGYAAIPVVLIVGLLILLGPARPRRTP